MGRDFELQNTHMFFFKSPRDFLQINTLSQQLGLGSQLKDWYTKATSIPYGCLLIVLTPKAVDSLKFCANSGSIPSIFFLTKTKQEIFLNDKHTKSLYTDNLPNVFPELQENVPKKLSKRFNSVSKRMNSKQSRRTTTGNTKTSRKKYRDEIHQFVQKINGINKRREILNSRKGIELISMLTSSIINRLS